MKNIRKLYFTAVMCILFSLTTLAQVPPHPNGGGGPGGGNVPVGGGAPLDGGLCIMILLAGAYGSQKLWRRKKK